MFTGIVEELGTVEEVAPSEKGRRLRVRAREVVADATVGASIAHNGVCLTVTDLDADGYWVDAVAETLARSTLGRLQPGDPVNLERPLRIGDRLGGHMVQGHVDGVGTVAGITPDGESTRMRIAAPGDVLRYVVEKGSITVDGVSLTVTDVDAASFAVALIPHTSAITTLGRKQVGELVNLEVDVIAKYVEKLVRHEQP